MKKAIVIGSGSGIGRALVFELLRQGWKVGAAGRRLEVLTQIKSEIKESLQIHALDVRFPETAMPTFCELVEALGGVDLVIANAGVLPVNPKFDWEPELEGARVNVIGFQAMCQSACRIFERQGYGHLVGISSIACHRGTGRAPSYNASKAFMAIYMEGLRQRYYGTQIHITDIRPGFVRTQMIEGRPGIFWDVSPEQAARDILKVVQKKKKIAYIPGRWWWVAQFWKLLPEWIYHRAYQKYISHPDYRDFPEIKKCKN